MTPKAVVRIGKCVDVVMKAAAHFDDETQVQADSGAHTSKSFAKDLQLIVHELTNRSQTFHVKTGRFHKSFKVSGEACSEQSTNKNCLSGWSNSLKINFVDRVPAVHYMYYMYITCIILIIIHIIQCHVSSLVKLHYI